MATIYAVLGGSDNFWIFWGALVHHSFHNDNDHHEDDHDDDNDNDDYDDHHYDDELSVGEKGAINLKKSAAWQGKCSRGSDKKQITRCQN